MYQWLDLGLWSAPCLSQLSSLHQSVVSIKTTYGKKIQSIKFLKLAILHFYKQFITFLKKISIILNEKTNKLFDRVFHTIFFVFLWRNFFIFILKSWFWVTFEYLSNKFPNTKEPNFPNVANRNFGFCRVFFFCGKFRESIRNLEKFEKGAGFHQEFENVLFKKKLLVSGKYIEVLGARKFLLVGTSICATGNIVFGALDKVASRSYGR